MVSKHLIEKRERRERVERILDNLVNVPQTSLLMQESEDKESTRINRREGVAGELKTFHAFGI